MRRNLANNAEEEPRIFRMFDLISRGAQGHGPVHFLLISAAELGFAWDGADKGWVRVSLPPLKIMNGPVQHFYSSIWDAWRFSVFAKLPERKVFWVVRFRFSRLFTITYLVPPAGDEIKCCLEPFCVDVFGTDSFLVRPRRMMFPVVFVVKRW